jgi:hypothetical protein
VYCSQIRFRVRCLSASKLSADIGRIRRADNHSPGLAEAFHLLELYSERNTDDAVGLPTIRTIDRL